VGERQPLIEVKNLVKHFPVRRGLFGGKGALAVRAVDDVSFDIAHWRDGGPGRRVGMREDHDRADGDAADHADRGRGLLRGAVDQCAVTRGGEALPPQGPDGLQDPYSSLNPR
jgi:hypothetical protein